MKKITILALLVSFQFFAQQQKITKKNPIIKLTGKIVKKNTNQPLEYATVVLTHLKNKKLTGGITDNNGNFSIEVPKGNYIVKFEFIGFITKRLLNKNLTENTNFGTIILSEDSKALDEVEITAEKSTVEIRLDKKIYNVGKDMAVTGGNASDVLENVPSVNVDSEGSVSLRGNENVLILIDGKPSALVGLNGTEALRNLPADAIEKVEVITSPSARYDAEGTAGILNIILRKGKIIGFNGSINTTIGHPDLFRLAPNINYRTKKINLFSNLGYSYRKSPGNSQSYFTNFKDGMLTGYRDEDRTFNRKNNNFNGSLGLEYYLTKNSSIVGSFFYRKSDGNDIATNISKNFDADKVLTSIGNRIENDNKNDVNKQYSLNYTNNFDGNGKKLTVNLQYGDSKEIELSPITVNGVLTEQNSQVTTSKDQLFQFDYTHPIGKNSRFEIGHKSTLQDLHSDFKVLNKDGNSPSNFDPSNAINFKQNIYAFYVQYGSKINKFSYLLGLRTEITDIDLYVITTNQFSDKNYTKWFPSANLGYELNETDNITLGYSRRLRRPRQWFLNPFESRSSATNIFRGNPNLNPSFTSSFDFGYTTKINKLMLNTSLYYQYSTSIMQMVAIIEERNGTNVFIRQPINLNDENRYGFEFTTNYSPAKWAKLSATFNYFKFKTAAFTYTYKAANGTPITTNLNAVNSSSWFTRFNIKITLPAKIQWQTRIMYRGIQKKPQSERKGIFVTNLSFGKDLFKEKASLVLNVNDLFNSRKRRSNTITYDDNGLPQKIVNGSFQWRERQISLSFIYRFNQKKKHKSTKKEFDEENGNDFGR